MSTVSFPDCFLLDDLLCAENSCAVLSAADESFPETELSSSGINPPMTTASCGGAEEQEYYYSEESIAGFIEDETNFLPGSDYLAKIHSGVLSIDAVARGHSVSWMLEVRAFYGFQALTTYLAVNYLDRYLCSHRLQAKGWPLQLLSVACLSLAAKMEEPLVPSLFDLQVEDAKYIFEPKTIQRMELLVLGILDWRLRSVTPFSFIKFFAYKLDATGTFAGFLIARSSEIILSNLQDASLLEYRPSSVAAAAVLCAGSEIPKLSLAVSPERAAESWCDGRLSKDKVINCYRLLMQQYVDDRRKSIKPSKTLPQLRVMSRTRARVRVRSPSFDYSIISSSCSSSTSFPTSITSWRTSSFSKRRKLSDRKWVDVDLGEEDDDDKGGCV